MQEFHSQTDGFTAPGLTIGLPGLALMFGLIVPACGYCGVKYNNRLAVGFFAPGPLFQTFGICDFGNYLFDFLDPFGIRTLFQWLYMEVSLGKSEKTRFLFPPFFHQGMVQLSNRLPPSSTADSLHPWITGHGISCGTLQTRRGASGCRPSTCLQWNWMELLPYTYLNYIVCAGIPVDLPLISL